MEKFSIYTDKSTHPKVQEVLKFLESKGYVTHLYNPPNCFANIKFEAKAIIELEEGIANILGLNLVHVEDWPHEKEVVKGKLFVMADTFLNFINLPIKIIEDPDDNY